MYSLNNLMQQTICDHLHSCFLDTCMLNDSSWNKRYFTVLWIWESVEIGSHGVCATLPITNFNSCTI